MGKVRLLPSSVGLMLALANCSSSDETRAKLVLPAGPSAAEAPLKALDPRSHVQTIVVKIKPPGTDTVIDFRTADGVVLHILSPENREECEIVEAEEICSVMLPVLEARLPGIWTAMASKTTSAPVVVDVDVDWEAVNR